MLLKSCGRCGNIIMYGSAYCSKCKPIVEAEIEEKRKASRLKSNKKYNKTRDPKYTHFYNSKEWRILSGKYAQDKGFRCECCGKIASQVHHKKWIQTDEGWALRLAYDNLELLCLDCHNERHERFKRRMEHIRNGRTSQRTQRDNKAL